MRNLPIGLFDSGVGGMTVLRALRAEMPEESYLFLGDTARLPYGTKSAETIERYALQASQKLVSQNIKLLVVACNTVSSTALPALRAAFPHIQVVGVVEPGAQAACAASQNGHIAVIATEATVRGGAYEKAIKKLRPEAVVRSKACPLFVPLAEDGLVEGPLAEGIADRYLHEIFADQQDCPDCLVLGCTHFPLLKSAIQNVVGGRTKLVDSAETTAKAVKQILADTDLRTKKTQSTVHFLTTDDTKRFARLGELFLGVSLHSGDVELVDL